MRKAVLLLIVLSTSSLFATPGCRATTYTPRRDEAPSWCRTGLGTIPAVHQAMELTDPANEQTVIVDLEWGGALASLKYQGIERFWGNDTGAMVQPAMHHGTVSAYNPQQAGDWGSNPQTGRGAPLYGAACKTDTLVLYTAAIDDQIDNHGYYGRAAGIRDQVVGDRMWFTPYAFTTVLKFVSSGLAAGTGPQYYLQMEQAVINTDATEGANKQEPFGFSFEMAMYMPGTSEWTDPAKWDANCHIDVMNLANSFHVLDFQVLDQSLQPINCGTDPKCGFADDQGWAPSSVKKLMTGAYTDSTKTVGIAMVSNPSASIVSYPAPRQSMVRTANISYDTFWNETVTGSYILGMFIDPLSARKYKYYFLAGTAAQARAFNPAN